MFFGKLEKIPLGFTWNYALFARALTKTRQQMRRLGNGEKHHKSRNHKIIYERMRQATQHCCKPTANIHERVSNVTGRSPQSWTGPEGGDAAEARQRYEYDWPVILTGELTSHRLASRNNNKHHKEKQQRWTRVSDAAIGGNVECNIVYFIVGSPFSNHLITHRQGYNSCLYANHIATTFITSMQHMIHKQCVNELDRWIVTKRVGSMRIYFWRSCVLNWIRMKINKQKGIAFWWVCGWTRSTAIFINK